MDTLDVFRSAKLFINQHGDLAAGKAVERAAELAVAGDEKGAAIWLAISNAIIWLENDSPVHGETRQ